MSDFFTGYTNIFNKTTPLEEPEKYDDVVFNINRYISMNLKRAIIIGHLTKYLWTLKGRYYTLLYSIFPKGSGAFVKWVKADTVSDSEKELLSNIVKEYNCSMPQAYRYKKIFEQYKIDLVKRYGGVRDKEVKPKRRKSPIR